MSNNGKARSKSERHSPDGAAPSGRRPSSDAASATGKQSGVERPSAPSLSDTELRHLESLEQKLQAVRDCVVSVATGRTTGLYVFGAGGAGKSFTIITELERMKTPYRIFNSRMTGRALYNALEKAPDEIHLLEDMEPLFRDSGARGVLRSALWSQPGRDGKRSDRLVTWNTHRMEHSFIFGGGIIMTGNRPFPPLPELDAIITRIDYLQLPVTDNEMAAMIRRVALDGYREGPDIMDPSECVAVTEFIVAECRGVNHPLDMRLLVNAFRHYLQWRQRESGCEWQDLVRTMIKHRPTAVAPTKTYTDRATQKQQELAIAKEIMEATDSRAERLKLWTDRTRELSQDGQGMSEQTLYRRMAELKGK